MRFHKQIKGFSLIELMVALVILMISMTAILHSIIQYQRINIENTMRNEAMRVVEARLEELRNMPYGTWPTVTTTTARGIRNISVGYSLKPVIETISLQSTAIRVEATWSYRGFVHRHNASTIISTDT